MFSWKASHPHKYKPRDICDPRIPPIYESCRGISAFFLCNGAIKQRLIKNRVQVLDSSTFSSWIVTIVAYFLSNEMIVRPSPEMRRKNASNLVTRGANEQCTFRPRMFECCKRQRLNRIENSPLLTAIALLRCG